MANGIFFYLFILNNKNRKIRYNLFFYNLSREINNFIITMGFKYIAFRNQSNLYALQIVLIDT